jgi:hypothetical protein
MADVGFEFGRDGRRAHAAVKQPDSVGLTLEHINYGGVDALSAGFRAGKSAPSC